MALVVGSKYGLYVYNNVADETPAPGVSQSFTIGKTVGGNPLVITMDPPRCMCPITWTHNGISYIKMIDHGQGIQTADNIIFDPSDATGWNVYSPTGSGSQADGVSLLVGTSNSLARYVAAAGDSFRHIQKPAFWSKPGQEIVPTHPGKGHGLISSMVRDVTMTIGAFGSDQIVKYTSTLTVPSNEPIINTLGRGLVTCPLTIYSDDTIFNQQEYVDASAGTVSAYPGYPASSTTLCVMTSHSDGSKGIAAYLPRSELGPLGFYQGYNTAGIYDSFVLARTDYPAGVPGQTLTQNAYIAWGTRAQTIAALQLIYSNVG